MSDDSFEEVILSEQSLQFDTAPGEKIYKVKIIDVLLSLKALHCSPVDASIDNQRLCFITGYLCLIACCIYFYLV